MAYTLSPIVRQQFNNNGSPVANGLLFAYAAGTTNKINTYKDATGSTPNTNPIVLDANGSCDLWLSDAQPYKLILSPAGDTDPPTNPLWTRDNIWTTTNTLQVQSAIYSYTAAPDSGTVNALAITLSPAPTALSAGMQVTTMNVVATNTGAATLNLNGLGVKPIVLPSGAALSGGEIYAGSAATFVYTGSSWMLQTRQPAAVVPLMTFAQIAALTSNMGPIRCSDMGDSLYTWTTSAYFTGYRNVLCGEIPNNMAASPRAWELATIGGTWSTSDPKQNRVIAWYQEQGLVVPSASWVPGMGMIASLGSGNWKAPDTRNMFWRVAGTDADTANPAPVGTYAADALQGHAHTGAAGTFGFWMSSTSGSVQVATAGTSFQTINFTGPVTGDGAHGAPRISNETRGTNARVASVILV